MPVKTAKITFIIILAAALIVFLREGRTFHIAKILPFCGGFKPSMYDAAAIALLLLMLWGLGRLKRRDTSDD